MSGRYSALFHCLLLLVVCLSLVHSISYSFQLSTELFENRNYDSGVRPMCDTNNKVNVTIDVALRQVIDLDEPLQILKVNIWVRLKWTDCQLTWNASEYGGLDRIIVPYDKVWIPDLALYDRTGEEMFGLKDYRASVYSDGGVEYNFPTNIESRCVVNVQYFPFDKQTCSLTFGSWMHNGEEVDFLYKNNHGDLDSYETNVEWDMLGFPAERQVTHYNCCPEPYPSVTFSLQLKRKPLFYVLNIILPCLIITAISLLGFLLPAESGEKVSLEITVLLALAVFLLMVASSLPASSETLPLLAIYFDFVMFLVCFATVMEVVVLNVHYKGHKPFPDWARRIFLRKIGRVVCFKQMHELTEKKPRAKTRSQEKSPQEPVKLISANGVYGGSGAPRRLPAIHVEKSSTNNNTSPSRSETPDNDASDTQNHIDNKPVIDSQLTTYDEHRTEAEWMALALVIDRMCLVIFAVVWIVGTLAIFMQFATV